MGLILFHLDKINAKLEKFQREMENQIDELALAQNQQLMNHEQLNSIQENLTKVNMDTVEDLPFSKFLVRFS